MLFGGIFSKIFVIADFGYGDGFGEGDLGYGIADLQICFVAIGYVAPDSYREEVYTKHFAQICDVRLRVFFLEFILILCFSLNIY